MASVWNLLQGSSLFLAAAFLASCGAQGDSLVVRTTKGYVSGVTLNSHEGKQVDAFLGIPYAKPPLGPNRFRHPKPMEPWTGEYDASTPPNSCMQHGDEELSKEESVFKPYLADTTPSEDCLTLSVWTPRPRPKGAAVMVWLNGMAFKQGGRNYGENDPRVLCAEEQLVVVHVTYRLGVFGFLHFNRTDAPGNAGLFDQLLALEWIRDNIRFFGGDADSVTLLGHTSGAASVGFHLLSPLSRNLFTRAILMSGASAAAWATANASGATEKGFELAEILDCPHDSKNVEATIECLQYVDPEELIHGQDEMNQFFAKFSFVPIVDGHFIVEPISASFRSKRFKKTEILTGVHSEEMRYILVPYLPHIFRMEEELQISRRDFWDSMHSMYPHADRLFYDMTYFMYAEWSHGGSNTHNRDAVGHMIGDREHICPSIYFQQRYAKGGGDVYSYVFGHASSVSPHPRWMRASQFSSLPYVFGHALTSELGYSEEEVQLSRKMMRYWANFARTGNPNRGCSREETVWPRYTTKEKEYLNLSANDTRIGKAFRANECGFWNWLMPAVEKNIAKLRASETPRAFPFLTLKEMLLTSLVLFCPLLILRVIPAAARSSLIKIKNARLWKPKPRLNSD